MTKCEAKLGGPGLDGYAYCADVYCPDCGRAIIDDIDAQILGDQYLSRSTEHCPQPIFFGESDTAQHCADCGKYLYGPRDEALAEDDQ